MMDQEPELKEGTAMGMRESQECNSLPRRKVGRYLDFKSYVLTLNKGLSSQGYGFSSGHVWM